MQKIFYSLLFILVCTNCTTRRFDITQIDFKAGGCFGTCPEFAMTIMNSGTAHYDAGMFDERHGQFTTTIRRQQLDSLLAYMTDADLLDLKDNYSTLITDLTTYTLTVTFANGRRKTIVDYGQSGPERLKRIYPLLFSLRETQDWRKTPANP